MWGTFPAATGVEKVSLSTAGRNAAGPLNFMTWKQARIIALQHIARLNVPRGLDGVTIVITDYDDEDLLRFIKVEEPDITLESQRMINQAFAREMRKRGARIERVLVNVNDYFSWLGKFDLTDSPAMRAQYISWLTCPEPKFTPHQI